MLFCLLINNGNYLLLLKFQKKLLEKLVSCVDNLVLHIVLPALCYKQGCILHADCYNLVLCVFWDLFNNSEISTHTQKYSAVKERVYKITLLS